MLKKIRVVLAIFVWLGVTLLFVDFTGVAHAWLGWLAKIQFLPALLALNVGVVIALVALTLLFGRVYCSVICPLGIMQDGIAWFGKRAKKNRYRYSPARNILRYGMLVLFVAALIAGIGSFVALLAPYSAYGRIAQNLLAPLWGWGNNLLAAWAEHVDSYAFYHVDVWVRAGSTFAIAVITLVVLAILSYRNGRTWCNTVCPVGTVLGLLSRFSLFRPVIDTSKCNRCGLCGRNCKSACIDTKNHVIDLSRCVVCMDCVEKCSQGAISYTWRRQPAAAKSETTAAAKPDNGRRSFLSATAVVAAATALKAEEKTVDGGLAEILDKKKPERHTRIVPPGAVS